MPSDNFQTPAPPQPRPDLPVPFGVEALTGHLRPPYMPPVPSAVPLDAKHVLDREAKVLAIVPTSDPKKLEESGWGVIFAADADPAIREALKPLLDRRKEQVGNSQLFKIFDGSKGVPAGQSAATWLANRGVGLAVVDPENGVPFHLLLIGSPKKISFEFQYTLDLQWSVGRLDFEKPEDYATYAANIVSYETAAVVPHGRDVAMWMPANGDTATNLLCNDVGLPFHQLPLGKKPRFRLHSLLGNTATKTQLAGLLDGSALGKPPAVLFTGSHGLEWPATQPVEQMAIQGALVTQEWKPGEPVSSTACFAGADVPKSALEGMIHYIFACFGGGCPAADNYPSGSTAPKQIAPDPMTAALPKALLLQGAQAVIAHIDRAWSYSFQSGAGLPQNQLMRSVLDATMLGMPVGLAADFLNAQWGTLAAEFGRLLGPQAVVASSPVAIANLMVARDDARNYIILGDPAARLRESEMV